MPHPDACPALDTPLLQHMASALRVLSADMVEQANSGHPGAPLGMADMATVLWARWLRHNPTHPQWPNRDRFVLSNGHASALLYALLHLSGYALPQAALREFRQWGSATPGHPEVGHTPGVETTTGPLGQGLANAVGMALAEQLLAREFNRPGYELIDHRTYAFVGDGCLMEGISQEVISLAGTLRLAKLTVLYDDNGISIDGAVRDWFADDTATRFRACGWRVIGPIDGHDLRAIDAALAAAKAGSHNGAGPALIICRTSIGKGAVGREGTAEVHGAPLGPSGVAALRQQLDWPHPPFEVPEPLRASWSAAELGSARERAWRQRFEAYNQQHPALALELQRRWAGGLPQQFEARVQAAVQALVQANAKPLATRRASQLVLDALAPALPELLGGSADLTGSNLTDFQGHRRCTPANLSSSAGNYLSYGVREFGMAAVMNGVALHGAHIPYGGTFLVFSDYSRNAIRMAALMKQRVIHVFTHDSLALGEDGPTHQPIEQLASLRLIPELQVWRPADGLECAVAWGAALARRDGPSCLVLSRQALPAVAQPHHAAAAQRGGYVLREAEPGHRLRGVILATGSEVALALQAQAQLLNEHQLAVRVVSMPCTQVFDAQDRAWQDSVLPPTLPTVAVEAGHPEGWWRYVGRSGAVLGVARFGASAPGARLLQEYGFTAEALVTLVRQRVAAASTFVND
ncbi:transketolase [Roseateles sp. BYS180W]|uniref:Transketolase n=1 Tax=Roseateles rivi TaxID=3299028 RepID=A0ABW7FU43_9BURK